MNKLFRDYTFTWLQVGIFKLAMLSIGLWLGMYFATYVEAWSRVILLVAVVSTLYISYVAFFGNHETPHAEMM